MKLGDILHILRFECVIEIRDKDGVGICTCDTNSKGVNPYINCEVVEWFPCDNDNTSTDAVFLIDLEDNE